MTNKEFISELAKRLEWTQSQTSAIMESAITLMNTKLANSDTINVQGFGSFETKQRQERVSVNPISKQRFLVPPKITPVFRPVQIVKDKLKKIQKMNDKLSLQDLADILSQQTQISKKEAELFFKEFFQLILSKIYENDMTKIKDFGTFKLTAISSRESVDVNTGEKIEIPAHNRLTFIPDKALKELVNAPFLKYQTILLEDGMDLSTVDFESQINTEEDIDSIDDNEVLKVIQEQVELVNEFKSTSSSIETDASKTTERESNIETIEQIQKTTLSKKDEASYRSTQKPFVYTYSNSKIDESKKDEDVILMTVHRRGLIPKIGEDSIITDTSKEAILNADKVSSKKIELKNTDEQISVELNNPSEQSGIDDASINIETTIYSISDIINKEQDTAVEKKQGYFDTEVDSESASTVSDGKIPTDIESYKSYNNPDRPLIPEESNNNQDSISTKIVSNTVDDVEEIDIDTTFINVDSLDLDVTNKDDKNTLSDNIKEDLSDESEERGVENDFFTNFEARSAKRAKLKKIIPIVILILVVLAVLVYGLFKLFDVKYDYERYQGLGVNNLTMADTLPYLYEEKESLPLIVKDSSTIQYYADSVSQKNAVVDNEIPTDTSQSTVVQNINGSLLLDGSTKNEENTPSRKVSDGLSINVVNKAQYLLQKKNERKDNDTSAYNLIENKANIIESSRTSIQSKPSYGNLITLEQGMTLRSIATKYYGNPNYWVYIYMANKEKLPNPDAITVGLKLVIPPLSKYGVINTKDPSEIQKALKLGAKILA